jgi:ParB family chromosome partitioning protein
MTEVAAGRRRLGRGLEALLGPTREQAERDGSLVELAISAIQPNPFQPRHDVDPAALEELKASIRQAGLLQPVVVRPLPDIGAGTGGDAEGGDGGGARYELIAGERRLRACQALGWERIPAVKRVVDDRTVLTLALIENLQRDDLSPVDEARGYERLIAEFSLAQQDVAHAVGRDRSTVANALRLLKLPNAVLAMLHQGELSVGHARALLALDDPALVATLARDAVAQGLSVREVEDRVRGGRAPIRRPRLKRGVGRAPEVRRVEDALRRRLGTDVRVTLRAKGKGEIRAAFYSNDDLARLLELLLGAPFDG